MRPRFIFLIYTITLSIGRAQFLFETPIFFEDAMGNKDTIRIGYDTAASTIYNPQLGELNLTDAFHSDFEVRACHMVDWHFNPSGCILSKKIIGACEKIVSPPIPCFIGESIIFFIKARYPPVRMQWDAEVFTENSNQCNYNSFFTPDYNYHLVNPLSWINWPDKRFACARLENEFVLNLDTNYTRMHYPDEYTFSIKRNFQGNEQEIFGVGLIFLPGVSNSPCIMVNTEDPLHSGNAKCILYPNPAVESLTIKNTSQVSLLSLQLLDIKTREVFRQDNSDQTRHVIEVNTDRLLPGVYFIKLHYSDHSESISKFIKL